jgi:putative DNA primase/helicase
MKKKSAKRKPVPKIDDALTATSATADGVNGFPRTEVGSSDGRPSFPASVGDLKTDAAEIWRLIHACNTPPTLYRAGTIAWIEHDDDAMPIIRQLNGPRLAHWLSRKIYFYKMSEYAGPVPAPPPGRLITDLLATPEVPLPIVTRIVRTPIFAPDGMLHDKPGYEAKTRAVYAPAPGFTLSPVAQAPTARGVADARATLLDVVGDFPFVSEADRALVLSALLALFVRDLIAGQIPVVLLTKPSPGTGASLCAKVLVLIATGAAPAAMTQCRDEDEWRKKLTSAFLKGQAVTFLDNLRGVLDSGQLSTALTADHWEDRVLGRNEIVRVPIRTVWLATGNNVVLSTELSRRMIRAKLDAKVERPWLRDVTFKHPQLEEWVRGERPRLVHAALTLVSAWFAHGCPEGTIVMGGYERWSRVLGGILDVAGIPGFLSNLDEFYSEADSETSDAKRFLATWWATFGDTWKSPRALLPLALSEDVALPLVGKEDQGRLVSLGRWLSRNRERHFALAEDLIVEIAREERSHHVAWRLAPSVGGKWGNGGIPTSADNESSQRQADRHQPHQPAEPQIPPFPPIPPQDEEALL